jgi:hypothetical protein
VISPFGFSCDRSPLANALRTVGTVDRVGMPFLNNTLTNLNVQFINSTIARPRPLRAKPAEQKPSHIVRGHVVRGVSGETMTRT